MAQDSRQFFASIDQGQQGTIIIDAIKQLQDQLAARDYVCDDRLATVLYLSRQMRRPLFLEGEAGVGKTELAKVLGEVEDTQLIRLQCYEGLGVAEAAYEWNAARQLMEIRMAEAAHVTDRDAISRDLYRREMLIERPLLQALTQPKSPVLLIDELDRADEPFEAYLLELLAEYQITIPELGTIKAMYPPMVVITSNRTREIRDALKRRCLYHWVEFPDARRELEIVRRKAPGAAVAISTQAVEFVQRLRTVELYKLPGVAETIDWVNALTALNVLSLDPDSVQDTLGVLLKYQEDVERVMEGEGKRIIDELKAAAIIR
jgi:MoxR-like ATPase